MSKIKDNLTTLTPEEISKVVSLPLSVVEKAIKELTETKKEPIANSTLYMKGDKTNLPQHLVQLDQASLSITGEAGNEKVERNLPEGHKAQPLYNGECSCENQCIDVLNILVLGQTGVGKTTLVDCLFNYILDVQLYDQFRYKLVDETKLIE